MHQEFASARDRKSTELAGYGDLSDFDPQASRRSKEQEEQDLIKLVMGGEDFLVGDGTLEFKLRDEEGQDLFPESTAAPLSRMSIPAADADSTEGEEGESTFAPIEAGHPDAGDAVAKKAVLDALTRLQSFTGEAASETKPVDEASDELNDEGVDEVLSGGFGGIGSELESEAPSPFQLPKLPSSLEGYMPNDAEALVTNEDLLDSDDFKLPAARSEASVGQTLEEVEPIITGDQRATLETGTEDFAPFEQTFVESSNASTQTSLDHERHPAEQLTASEEELDHFLPLANTPEPEEESRFEPEAYSPPSYTQARDVEEARTPEIEEIDPFEQHMRDRGLERESEQIEESQVEEVDKRDSNDAEPQVAVAPVRKSFIQQNWMVLVAGTFIAGLVGFKTFMMNPSDPAAEKTSATDQSAPQNAAQDLSTLLPEPTTPTEAEPVAPEVTPAAPSIDPMVEAKLAELTARMSALETERDHLRDENQKLKQKPVARPKVQATKPVAKKIEIAPEPAPARKPRLSLQYLGTFSEGDRMVAEVLLDGRLLRVKRGDVLTGGSRVDGVAEMSVTIDDVEFGP